MPINGFNVGRDVSLSIILPSGNIPTLGITSFSRKQMQVEIKSKRLDGKTYFAQIPDGWGGTLKFDRISPSIDAVFDALEQAYYAGNDLGGGTLYETIQETSNQGVTKYRYDGVVLKYTEPGTFEGDKRVEQTVEFVATSRTKVS